MMTDKDKILLLKKEVVDLQSKLVEKVVEKEIEIENTEKIQKLESVIASQKLLIEKLESDIISHKTECDMMRTKYKILCKADERIGNAIFDQ